MRIVPGNNKSRLRAVGVNEEQRALMQHTLTGFKENPKDKTDISFANTLLNKTALEYLELIPREEPPDTPKLQLDARLFDYQVSDVLNTLHLSKVLNANPMGYGKTVEALQWCKTRGHKYILIVCPKSTMKQWQVAVKQWFSKDVYPQIATPEPYTNITIINPELLIRREAYLDYEFDCMIVDEVHRAKNVDTNINKFLRKIDTKDIIGLTGTPIMNRPDDLFGIGMVLNPNIFGRSYWNFVNIYCTVEENFWGKRVSGATNDPIRKEILKATLNKFWIRNPENLVGMGELTSDVVLSMYKEQEKLYKKIVKLAIDELEEMGISIPNGMSQIMRMQQTTTHPSMFPEYVGGSAKMDWVKDLLLDNPNLKIVVFSKFSKAINELQKILKADGVCKVSTITGGVSAESRSIAIEQFTNDDNVRVLAGTIGAMGTGVDGIQYASNTVIFLDVSWSPEENRQAVARVNRIGQSKRVNVYRLICEGTIDEYVDSVSNAKLEDIKELIWREGSRI